MGCSEIFLGKRNLFRFVLINIILSSILIGAIKEKTNRVFTAEELAKYKGENEGDEIYLSILGEVYDVTTGKEFYAPDHGYSFFSGRDATICFFTGEYTEEHLNEKSILDFQTHEIFAMDDWRSFYETHETYRFLGVLEGDYYDREGKVRPYLKEIREKIEIGRKEVEEKKRKQEEEQKRRKAERLAREAAQREEEERAEKAEKENNEEL